MSIHALPPHPVVLPVVAVDLGVLIRSRRNARRPRMTQAQLGATIGYSAAWVCRVEKNELTPPGEILIRIARILTITPEWPMIARGARLDIPSVRPRSARSKPSLLPSDALWPPPSPAQPPAQPLHPPEHVDARHRRSQAARTAPIPRPSREAP
ncbi:multiprotein-bridging factor 1 family protein [Streptomyces sp. NPDC058086]|uniref:helix-turn-helix domain-containing protein n=1 Tax=Streptomyces sp. NPDC058086 TaxID=3346334 RepID=UPI0036E12904